MKNGYLELAGEANIKGEEGVTDFLLQLVTVSEGDDDNEEGEVVDLFDEPLPALLACSLLTLFSFLRCWILVVFTLSGITQLHKIPIRARRLTQLGMGFPVSLTQASLQKWLQFLVIRL